VTKLARGNVHWVALDPVIGSELRKTRPCVIVSPDEMNESLRTVIVAPLTSKGFAAPFRVDVPTGRVLCEQIRAGDRSRVREFFSASTPRVCKPSSGYCVKSSQTSRASLDEHVIPRK